MIQLRVNGQDQALVAAPGETLLTVLRDRLALTGAKAACGRGECGACTVLLDGKPVVACMLLAHDVGSREITTIEGLAEPAAELRAAFADHAGFQCGFCTPGQIVRAEALLREAAADPARPLDETAVRQAMSGNVCRCTGYAQIIDATLATAAGRKAGVQE